jgi:hypothetical protein
MPLEKTNSSVWSPKGSKDEPSTLREIISQLDDGNVSYSARNGTTLVTSAKTSPRN